MRDAYEEECLGCETGVDADEPHKKGSKYHPNCQTTAAEKERAATKGGKKKSKKRTTKKSKKRTTKKSKKRTTKKRK